jgi:hypothetical protein
MPRGRHHVSRVLWAYLVAGTITEELTGYAGRHRS